MCLKAQETCKSTFELSFTIEWVLFYHFNLYKIWLKDALCGVCQNICWWRTWDMVERLKKKLVSRPWVILFFVVKLIFPMSLMNFYARLCYNWFELRGVKYYLIFKNVSVFTRNWWKKKPNWFTITSINTSSVNLVLIGLSSTIY